MKENLLNLNDLNDFDKIFTEILPVQALDLKIVIIALFRGKVPDV